MRVNLTLQEVLPPLLDALAERWTVVDGDGVILREGPGPATCKLLDWTPLARFGYQDGFKVEQSTIGGSLKIMANHPSARGWCFLSGSQSFASFVLKLERDLRKLDKLRHPSEANRIDWALDFKFPHQLVDEMFGAARTICDNYRGGLPRHRIGDDGCGQTFYFGTRPQSEATRKRTTSVPAVSARLYQKGFEQGARLDWPEGPDPDWWRFEVMARPDATGPRQQLLGAPPEAVLGSRKWSVEMLARIGYTGVSPGWSPDDWESKLRHVEDNKRKASALRTLAHMADQYRNAALDLAELVGRDQVERLLLDALFTPRPVERSDPRPGDHLRQLADRAWIDATDPRFTGAPRPVVH